MQNETTNPFELLEKLLHTDDFFRVARLYRNLKESPPLPAESEDIETIDKILSSNHKNRGLKKFCFLLLTRAFRGNMVLPKSYHPPRVTVFNGSPYWKGRFADTVQAEMNGVLVCIKVFRVKSRGNLNEMKKRFQLELIAWKYMKHKNVVPSLGFFQLDSSSFWIIRPWLVEGNIKDYTKEGPMDARQYLLAQAAHGLEYLHSFGIVHGDINPGNILITKDDVAVTACLTNFGVAALMTDPTVVGSDSEEEFLPGFARYMAPELIDPQTLGPSDRKPTKHSDIYSFAITAYEVLTGTLSYKFKKGEDIARAVLNDWRPEQNGLQGPMWYMVASSLVENPEQRLSIESVRRTFP